MIVETKDKTDLTPKCYFCKQVVTEEDYCYGCEQYVCEKCFDEDGDFPVGKHQVEDHMGGKK